MEDYLNNLKNLRACYEKFQFNEIMSLNNQELRALCSEERLNVIRDLTSEKLLTNNLINERIKILHERERANIQNRRDYLDKKFN